MLSEKFKRKNISSQNDNDYQFEYNFCNNENSYEQYLRKKYKLPDEYKILIKQGYVLKDRPNIETSKLSQRGKWLDAQFRLNKIIYDEIENEILKIYGIIDNASEEIEILEIQNSSYEMNGLFLQTEVESVAEKMFNELSNFVHKITQKSYKKVYENLIQIWDDVIYNSQKTFLEDENLAEKELYDIINSWLKNFKKWIFDSINSAFDDLLLETKSYVQKGFFSDTFENIKNTFSKVKEKIDTMIRNAVSHAQTTAQKIAFKVQRVESYEVILSGHPNTCDKCREMANGKPRNIAELSIGETAPPFHPNCGCTIIPYAREEKDGSLWEQVVIAANVAFEILAQIGPLEKLPLPVYRQIKSAIWAAGNFYLDWKGYDIAKELFTWGMYGEGKELPSKVKDMMIEELKNSDILKEKIREYTQNGEDFNSGKTSVHFTPKEPNLHYSVQNAYLWLEGKKLDENGKWEIKVKLEDEYDFTTFRNSLEFTDLANNLGEAMQRNGMMTEFTTKVEFEHIFEGL